MKKIVCIAFLYLCNPIEGQTIEKQVIGTSGQYISNASVSLDFTMGETAVTTITNGSVILEQGFNQGDNNLVLWDGSTGTAWNEETNWSNTLVPLTTHNVIIPNVVTTPVIGGGVTAHMKNLTINAASEFTISSDGATVINENFANNGTTNITSTMNNSGVLLVRGISNGEITYERGGLLGNKWSIVTAPVSGQSIKEFAENPVNNIRLNTAVVPNRYAIGYYDDSKVTGTKWTYYTKTDLATNALTFEKGKSYTISRETAGSVLFTGTLETLNVMKPVVASQWNAVGNPYTAFLPINENGGTNFINDNISKFESTHVGVYVWNKDQSKYVGKSLISSESALAPGQGFFVKTTTGVSEVVFKEAQRKVQPLIGGVFNKGTSLKKIPSIQLLATSNEVTIETNIKYYANASEGLDPGYDLGNYARANFDVFTRLLDGKITENFTMQSLPNSSYETMVIPIGIKVNDGEKIRFSVNSWNLPEGIEVFIEDKELHTITKVGGEKKGFYEVKVSEKVNGVGRFYLHTKLNEVLVDILNIGEVQIYNLNNKELIVEGISKGDFELKIYSTLGTTLSKRTIVGKGKNIINLSSLETGVYIVRIDSELGVKSKKIIIK